MFLKFTTLVHSNHKLKLQRNHQLEKVSRIDDLCYRCHKLFHNKKPKIFHFPKLDGKEGQNFSFCSAHVLCQLEEKQSSMSSFFKWTFFHAAAILYMYIIHILWITLWRKSSFILPFAQLSSSWVNEPNKKLPS